jgi:hypothetical protein
MLESLKKLVIIVSCLFRIPVFGQAYWQQEVHYKIIVSLNDTTHTLRGTEELIYINHSPDSLTFLWFHIWPNAYRDKSTALFRQMSDLGISYPRHKFNHDNGFIDSLLFLADGQTVKTEPDPRNPDVIKLILPQRLLPGQSTRLTTPFFVKIPIYFSRMGHVGQSYMITQWYPKPAVYDRKGWHPFPYLEQGEFYSEFGTFEVQISLPAAYTVAATGVMESGKELESYKKLGRHNNLPGSVPELYHSSSSLLMKTLDFHAEQVHDFAWFADKDFIISYDTMMLPSGKTIDAFAYYHGLNPEWKNSVLFIKDAVAHYSDWIGEYEYPVVNAVEGPANGSAGGMEYPMITLITSPHAGAADLDGIITHEVGHNWFYGMLGTNERDHPWMDEGINTYYEFLYEAEKYRNNTSLGFLVRKSSSNLTAEDVQSLVYSGVNRLPTRIAIENPATAFDPKEYAWVEYYKTALWMYIMEQTIGKEKFNQGMHAYFRDWKFKHPYPEDMQASLELATQTGLQAIFDLLLVKGSFR